jgi:hypothetical protein
MTRALVRAALAAALLAAVPAAAQAQARRAAAPAPDAGLRLAGLLGLEFGAGDTGLALRVDGEMPIQAVGRGTDLSGVLSLGFSRFDDDGRGWERTTNLVKLVPAIRLTLPALAPQLGAYGDVGLGFYYQSTSVDDDRLGARDFDDSGVGLAMRFAGGLFFDVNDRLRLGGEVGVNPYFGEFDETTVSLLATLSYRL